MKENQCEHEGCKNIVDPGSGLSVMLSDGLCYRLCAEHQRQYWLQEAQAEEKQDDQV